MADNASFRTAIRIWNSLPGALTLWFEPWAENVSVAPNGVVLVEVRGPSDEPIDVEYSPDGIIVYADRGNMTKVIDVEGRVIWQDWESAP